MSATTAAASTAAASPFRVDRQRIIGVIGAITGVILFWLVSSKIAMSKITTLRITYPNAKPTDPSLLDIPLPTVITTGVIALLLVAGAVYLFFSQRPRLVSIYMGWLIFAAIFIVLIWA